MSAICKFSQAFFRGNNSTFFGRVSVISFIVTLWGSGSPICLKPYISLNCFLSSALSNGEGAIGTATARTTFVFLKEIKQLFCLDLIWGRLSHFKQYVPAPMHKHKIVQKAGQTQAKSIQGFNNFKRRDQRIQLFLWFSA